MISNHSMSTDTDFYSFGTFVILADEFIACHMAVILYKLQTTLDYIDIRRREKR